MKAFSRTQQDSLQKEKKKKKKEREGEKGEWGVKRLVQALEMNL